MFDKMMLDKEREKCEIMKYENFFWALSLIIKKGDIEQSEKAYNKINVMFIQKYLSFKILRTI